MSNLRGLWFSNSFINILGGFVSAIVSLLLPAVVVNYLGPESFSVWTLALQVVVYVNLLSLGLQNSTARMVAHEINSSYPSETRLSQIAHAARNISYWVSSVSIILVLILVVCYPLIFSGVNDYLIGTFRITLFIFGVAAILQILVQADMGVFQGLHRNVIFVSVQTFARVLSLLFVWLGVYMEKSIMILASLMTLAMLLQWPLMRWASLTWVSWENRNPKVNVNKGIRKDLLHYCGTFSVWSVSMLLVNSIGILVVGYQDFRMAGSYALAMTVVSVVVGLFGAFLSPLLTTTAALYADEKSKKQLPNLLTFTTLIVGLFLNIVVTLSICFYPEIIQIWLGKSQIDTVGPLMIILISGHCLRNIVAPYALMLIGTGLNKRALTSAILEGVANLIASVVFGLKWGAIGAASGTLLGSLVGVAGTLLINTFRTPELTPNPLKFALLGVFIPIILFIPIDIYFILTKEIFEIKNFSSFKH